MPTIAERREKVLIDLKTTGIIDTSAIVSPEGLLMKSDISDEAEAKMLAAMSAMVFNAAKKAISEPKSDVPVEVVIESKKGKMVVISTGPKALLVARADPHTELGASTFRDEGCC
ncbi:MAG: roadblock/LC7 domain-containing protein [Methanocellales archaeon]|nr:roadblock/LC7 domain-containing protein [Methanocellales archaeon]